MLGLEGFWRAKNLTVMGSNQKAGEARCERGLELIYDSLDLIERHGIVPPIVESSGAGGFMASHLLRHFELAAVL